MAATHALEIRGVSKTFGDRRAVSKLDLTVEKGAIAGFIGPNGAGKTTTIRMLLSILEPDEGTIRVLGNASAALAKDSIGYLPEERGVYRRMRVGAFLAYIARLKDVRASVIPGAVRAWLDRVGLADSHDRRCEELSKGMQQKVQFVAAVIHEPQLLILDEPFSGLDPVSTRLLRELIAEQQRRGTTILFSTHVMRHAEELCDHVLMMNRGEKVLDASMAEIRESRGPATIAIERLDDVTGLPELEGSLLVDRVAPATEGEARGRVQRVWLREGVSPADAVREIAAALPARRIELLRPTLEDVFLELVGSGEQGGSAAH